MKTYPVYLNGELTITEKTYEITNPAKGEVVARMSQVERAAVAQAIEHAHVAFRSWRNLPGKKRGELLRQVAAEVNRRRDEIARLITLENGKPLSQSEGEVAMTVDHLTWFAEEARRGYGRLVPNQVEGKRHLVIKTPIGVVAAISPWNFPLVLAVRKIAPALAAGCTVSKPASKTPICGSLCGMRRCCKLPKVFQLVAGSASDTARNS
jgi:succinate-semialdehyde dehydrogenase/glutarate-semialdehyde dehydrogenase